MVAPTGDQFEISGGGYRAVVTEGGAALRLLEYDGRALLDGFGVDEMSPGGRGQLLVPWPNRIAEGRFDFDGQTHQLALTEPTLGNAHHGLVRWVAWTVEELGGDSVSLVHRLMAQRGYPWTLDLQVLYDLSADGLTVTTTATNLADSSAPYASGAHPYLAPGPVAPRAVDGWELTLPAATRVLVDDQLLPTVREPVEGTGHDFRVARPIRGTRFDDAFTDLDRDADGNATVVLEDPRGTGVALWMDRRHRWVQVFTADNAGDAARRSLAVEPMTAPANAFRSGVDLVTLAPAGSTGDEFSASWGLRALD